ncbi:hypothetical protein SELMODRAFT_445147 [Selaginella moellendorffii]|uniref:F-box domain-containing protein n=1 Tax=Selaginella moellendorffii TaxID=88036 RepID=D8SG55_SELML|nr:hypothetical protein SELMODRAFT_445147 [Selaginella moellendorffii]
MAARERKQGSAAAQGWSELPSDLLERVCLRLCVADVCRLRAVCREWSLFLRSAQFMHNHATATAAAAPPAPHQRWIVVYTDQMYAFVNGRRWLPVSSPAAYRHHCRIPRRHEEEYQADVVADGAMVCVSRRSLINDNSVREVFVYNPVAKLRLDLPKLQLKLEEEESDRQEWPRWRPWALSSGPGRSFKLLFLRYQSSQFYLFDADRAEWLLRTMPRSMMLETVQHDDFSQAATCIAGVAYCVNWDRSAVLTYSVDKDSWGKIDTPLTRHSRNYLLIEPQIVKGPKLAPMLVAGVRKRRNAWLHPRWRRDADDQADVVSIWELDTGSMTWSKICEKACELTSYALAGNEQHIFVIPHGNGEVLAYDTARNCKCSSRQSSAAGKRMDENPRGVPVILAWREPNLREKLGTRDGIRILLVHEFACDLKSKFLQVKIMSSFLLNF